MIQHKQRVHAGNRTAAALLPVHPPEINAGAFKAVQDHFLKGLQELLTGGIKIHRVFAFRVNPHGTGHLRIEVLARTDAVRRMIIQRHFQMPGMEPVHHFLRIREHLRIPGIARPSRSVFGIDIRHMPVHINDRHGQRHTPPGKVLHQFLVSLIRITIVPAPPVPQCIARQRRRLSGEVKEITQGLLETPAIGKQIQIDSLPVGRKQTAAVIHAHGMTVIKDRKSLQ